jgi:hypothetical protein
MAAFNKFNIFVEDLANGVHNFTPSTGNTLKVYLTNETPSASADSVKADLAEISSGNGYTADGNTATITSSSQTTGTYKLVLGDPATWTATGAGIGPFRYAVLYNSSTTAKTNPLIGWWDYGSAVTLASGESFAVDFDPGTGVLTLA